MTRAEIIVKTQAFLKDKFSTESSGHDYWHMYRTWKVAEHIASNESDAHMLRRSLIQLKAKLSMMPTNLMPLVQSVLAERLRMVVLKVVPCMIQTNLRNSTTRLKLTKTATVQRSIIFTKSFCF